MLLQFKTKQYIFSASVKEHDWIHTVSSDVICGFTHPSFSLTFPRCDHIWSLLEFNQSFVTQIWQILSITLLLLFLIAAAYLFYRLIDLVCKYFPGFVTFCSSHNYHMLLSCGLTVCMGPL